MDTIIKQLVDYFNGYHVIKSVQPPSDDTVERSALENVIADVYMRNVNSANSQDYYTFYRKMENAINETGLEWTTTRGKITKRLLRLLPELEPYAGILGDQLTRKVYRGDPPPWLVSLSDTIFWDDGNFGKSNSCWWDSYKESQQVFEEAGGITLLWHKNASDWRTGIARCFIAPIDEPTDGIALFNQYGQTSENKPIRMEETADTLARLIPDSKVINAYLYNDNDDNIPYINGNAILAILPSTAHVFCEHDYHVEWGEGGIFCHECGTRLHDDDAMYDERNGDAYCEDCYSDNFTRCNHCDEEIRRRDAVEIDYTDYCEYCATQLFSTCENCGEYIPDDDIIIVDDLPYCENCVINCDTCNEPHTRDGLTWTGSKYECQTCLTTVDAE